MINLGNPNPNLSLDHLFLTKNPHLFHNWLIDVNKVVNSEKKTYAALLDTWRRGENAIPSLNSLLAENYLSLDRGGRIFY